MLFVRWPVILGPVQERQQCSGAPSSSGLGRRPLKAVARVRIPSGLHICESAPPGAPASLRRSWNSVHRNRCTKFQDRGRTMGTLAAVSGVLVLSGALHAATGFGFALLSAPVLAALLGPQEA